MVTRRTGARVRMGVRMGMMRVTVRRRRRGRRRRRKRRWWR